MPRTIFFYFLLTNIKKHIFISMFFEIQQDFIKQISLDDITLLWYIDMVILFQTKVRLVIYNFLKALAIYNCIIGTF